jgi:hypothetical protein
MQKGKKDLTFQRTLSGYHIDNRLGGLEATKRFLKEHSERLKTEKIPSGRFRILDYMLISVFTNVDDNKKAYDFCKLFLEHGANPHTTEYHQASVGQINQAAERTLELVKLFHKHGANINHDLYGQPGCWPLISAISGKDGKGNLDIVKYLVENGAVVNFLNYWSQSPLDFADKQPRIYKYLKSVGAKHSSELPREHLDKMLNAQKEVQQKRFATLSEHLKHYFGKMEHFEYPTEDCKNPSIRFLKGCFELRNQGVPFIITEGMSSRVMNTEGVKDGVRRAELMVIFRTTPPVSKESLTKENHHHKLNWLKKLAQMPFDTNQCYRKVNIIPNGKPPKPLHEDTKATGIYLRTAIGDDWQKWVRPDGETVEIMIATHLYQDEIDFLKSLSAKEVRKFISNEMFSHYYKERESYMIEGKNVRKGVLKRMMKKKAEDNEKADVKDKTKEVKKPAKTLVKKKTPLSKKTKK